jgi:hypothetical protein
MLLKMIFSRICITIVLTILVSAANGQYGIPLHASGNSGGRSTDDAMALLSVTGQNVIGKTSDTSHQAFLGLLPPLMYVLTDVEMSHLRVTRLLQNYPNPFREKTTLPFEMNRPGKVTLTVYNVLGQPIEILMNKQMPPGKHLVEIDAQKLTPGLFFSPIRIGDYVSTKSMVLTK